MMQARHRAGLTEKPFRSALAFCDVVVQYFDRQALPDSLVFGLKDNGVAPGSDAAKHSVGTYERAFGTIVLPELRPPH
jgi:hypothetical protein